VSRFFNEQLLQGKGCIGNCELDNVSFFASCGELETEVFCSNCLFDKELSVDDVTKAIAEVKAFGRFLNTGDCV
jgi:hypothetical protein